MVVLIREKRVFEDGSEGIELAYRGRGKPTPDQIKRAEKFDDFLAQRMAAISKELEEKGLLDKKHGNKDRWYLVGKRLALFIDNPQIVAAELKQQDYYIWVAIEQNTPKELQPNQENKERQNTLTKRNHYRLCYLVSKFPKETVKLHTWREWVEILESPALLEDDRIFEWLIKTMAKNPELKLRELARAMRNRLKNLYTKVFSKVELNTLLDNIMNEVSK
jgi:hypothetical protein